MQSVHDPAELPSVLERWNASIATGAPFEMTFPLRGADGLFRPFLTRVSPQRNENGDVVRWFGVNTEVGAQLRAEQELLAVEARYRTLTEAMPQMVWSARPDGFQDFYNTRWYEFTGAPVGSVDGERWTEMFHPDDREHALELWRRSLETGEPYEIESRLRHRAGEYRWTLGRALPARDSAGQIIRWIGTCTDIHEAKRSVEQNDLLRRELVHRIKNFVTVIAGLVRFSARRFPLAAAFAADLEARIVALGSANDFVRPAKQGSIQAAAPTLHAMLRELLKPYETFDEPRISIEGEDLPVGGEATAPIALTFHELATNTVKYGALSGPSGTVRINTRLVGQELVANWLERGGPPVQAPTSTGFGSVLTEMSIERQLGGKLQRSWSLDGLEVEISVRADQLTGPE